MEKFNDWRDPGTGIHPFLPTQRKYNVATVFFGLFLVLVRIPIIATLMVYWLIFDTILSFLRLKKVQVLIDRAFGKSILVLCGFLCVNCAPFVKRYSCLFLFPEVKDDTCVQVLSFYDALICCITKRDYIGKRVLVENLSNDIYVLFIEGTTSNGRAILKPANINLQPIKERLHLISIRYEFLNFSPTYVCESFSSHIFGLCSQFYNSITIRSMNNFQLSRELLSEEPLLQSVCFALSRLSKLRLLSVKSAEDKTAFLKFYNKKKNK
ncbi:hypothetical protein ROZALSC1DRAFT_30780 [Rozella allomycis CSF55]|uniref:Uncharacterized protein n=1 Tax=Rozella allomycis (strain CSF55) TaxID=988480 RepID=A0A4P9YES0_ROZAC|nr:hypothetical protein ROZALSC1DRAFT_30780 [Rozella allomycis CSF55]